MKIKRWFLFWFRYFYMDKDERKRTLRARAIRKAWEKKGIMMYRPVPPTSEWKRNYFSEYPAGISYEGNAALKRKAEPDITPSFPIMQGVLTTSKGNLKFDLARQAWESLPDTEKIEVIQEAIGRGLIERDSGPVLLWTTRLPPHLSTLFGEFLAEKGEPKANVSKKPKTPGLKIGQNSDEEFREAVQRDLLRYQVLDGMEGMDDKEN